MAVRIVPNQDAQRILLAIRKNVRSLSPAERDINRKDAQMVVHGIKDVNTRRVTHDAPRMSLRRDQKQS